MEDRKTQQPEQNRNFFDDLMFGPPQNQIQEGAKSEEVENSVQAQQPLSSVNPQQNSELDMMQMMQSLNTLMGYMNKLGPTLQKFGPIMDVFKSFTNNNTKK